MFVHHATVDHRPSLALVHRFVPRLALYPAYHRRATGIRGRLGAHQQPSEHHEGKGKRLFPRTAGPWVGGWCPQGQWGRGSVDGTAGWLLYAVGRRSDRVLSSPFLISSHLIPSLSRLATLSFVFCRPSIGHSWAPSRASRACPFAASSTRTATTSTYRRPASASSSTVAPKPRRFDLMTHDDPLVFGLIGRTIR